MHVVFYYSQFIVIISYLTRGKDPCVFQIVIKFTPQAFRREPPSGKNRQQRCQWFPFFVHQGVAQWALVDGNIFQDPLLIVLKIIIYYYRGKVKLTWSRLLFVFPSRLNFLLTLFCYLILLIWGLLYRLLAPQSRFRDFSFSQVPAQNQLMSNRKQ